MDATLRSLEELRHEIDMIDSELHSLICRRGGLANEIAEIKHRAGLDKIRPGREAILLRNLVARHEGDFPVGAVLRIWRELISSLIQMEMSDYAVAVYAKGEDQGFWDLARDQFGSRTPMTTHPSARDAISQVIDGTAALAVVPCPSEDMPGDWWPNLCVLTAPRIVYRLPFFGRGNARGGSGDALAIGWMSAEKTGDDRTVLVLETRGDLSRTRLSKLLSETDLKPTLLAPNAAGARLCYAEVEGFVVDGDMRLKFLQDDESIDRATIIGNYATPMLGPITGGF
ncbi:MAG: chorismate mutase [Pseudomonadota bacterium]|nr:chorismate mutase [Pseudomonadota bacterium]